MPESKELNQVTLRSLSTLKPTVLGEESENEPIDLSHIPNQSKKKRKHLFLSGRGFILIIYNCPVSFPFENKD